MSIYEIWVNYGFDIITMALLLIGYFVTFLFKRMVTNTKKTCLMALTNKEDNIIVSNKKVLLELENAKKENQEIKAELARIRAALLHLSEVENGENREKENTDDTSVSINKAN